jgi:hypothetical protein
VRKHIERSKVNGQIERSQREQIRLAKSKEQDLEAAKDRNTHGSDTKGEGTALADKLRCLLREPSNVEGLASFTPPFSSLPLQFPNHFQVSF